MSGPCQCCGDPCDIDESPIEYLCIDCYETNKEHFE